MNKRIEQLLKDYPAMIQERNCTAHEVAHFQGVTVEEVIESMYSIRPDGERVRASGTSEKTAQIALNYKSKMEEMNRDWYDQLAAKLKVLTDELIFFDSALAALSGNLPGIMRDMVVGQMTWDALAERYYVSRRMIGKYRRKAIRELDMLYQNHDRLATDYMLG